MVHPQTFNRVVAALLAALGALTAITSLAGPLPAPLRGILTGTLVINGFFLAAVLLTALGATFYAMNKLLFEERARHDNTRQQLETVTYALRDSERIKHTDVVTGVPNQRKWQIDVERIGKIASDTRPFQQIFIDLDGFRQINAEFGYSAGDKVLAYFARSVHESMRRDEEIYKRPFAEMVGEDELWKRIYRKYTGGDEFLFLISGREEDALGFLTRLQRRVSKDFNPHIAQILGRPHALSFHGAVCPIFPDDDADSALTRVQDGLRIAMQSGSQSRVFWFSRRQSCDIDGGEWVRRIYADAETLFAKAA